MRDHPKAKMTRVCKEYGYLPDQYRTIKESDVEWLDNYPAGLQAEQNRRIREREG